MIILMPLTFKGATCKLSIPKLELEKSFLSVLEGRKSRYEFGLLPLEKLGDFLFYSSRTKETDVNQLEQIIQKRNSAAPGALHSIHCFVSQPLTHQWFHYNNQMHSLEQMSGPSPEFIHTVKELVHSSELSWLIWYVCDIELLESKYQEPLQLALRETGNLAATQHLVAEMLNFNFTQLGVTGEIEAQVLSNQRRLVGTGFSLVGASLE